MNEPRYTATELRHLLADRRPIIAETVVSKLTDDAVFEAASFQLKDVTSADGSVHLDAPPVRALIGGWIDSAVVETINAILDDLDAR